MIQYLLLGIIEGITEFLPISSTAHLIIASYFLKISQTEFHKFFEVFIQIGAILAVILIYFQTLIKNKKLVTNIFFSFIPTAILGIVFYKIIKNIFFENNLLISLMLIIIGGLFILIEYLINKNKITLKKDLNQLTIKKSILIGLIQALAIIPGISRAGAVILIMLILKFKRQDAVIYSFLLAIPTIVSAGLFDFYKTDITQILNAPQNLSNLIIGFITSFIFAFITINWFIKYLQKNNLIIFGFYRILLGLSFLLLYFY